MKDEGEKIKVDQEFSDSCLKTPESVTEEACYFVSPFPLPLKSKDTNSFSPAFLDSHCLTQTSHFHTVWKSLRTIDTLVSDSIVSGQVLKKPYQEFENSS